MFIVDDITNPSVFKPKVGTIDYTKGLITLNTVLVEAFDGSSVKIMVRPKENTIKAAQGRVFIIRDEDVQVNMILDEKPVAGTTTSSAAIGTLTSSTNSNSY
jgi:hypothetical protein